MNSNMAELLTKISYTPLLPLYTISFNKINIWSNVWSSKHYISDYIIKNRTAFTVVWLMFDFEEKQEFFMLFISDNTYSNTPACNVLDTECHLLHLISGPFTL